MKLRALAETKPLVVVAGLRVDGKIRLIRKRFALDVEWHEIDHDSPRSADAMVESLRVGKVGAVIFLEGFARHDVFHRVRRACEAGGVPVAMADRGGIGSIERALHELEGQLT